MKLKEFFLQIIPSALIFISLSLLASNCALAQSCRSGCSEDSQCWNWCKNSEYGCFHCGGGTTCCYCEYGYEYVPSGEGCKNRGPLICANSSCSNADAPCCNPAPTSPPAPTNTPTICCQGPYACPNITRYEDCIAAKCTWNTACPIPPSPTTALMWLCQRPGAIDPDSRCSQGEITCTKPDVPGGLCYTTQSKCSAGCIIKPSPTLIPRPTQRFMCYYQAGRYGIDTAVGCFPVDDRNEMIAFVLRWSIGVSGGIVFLLIVYSGFLIMGSGANVEKVKAGKSLFTAAITGLILIIFSVFLLDLIGLRILQIPGL